MILRQFLAQTTGAPASRRAEAAADLARSYLYGDLAADAAWEAKTALLALLDDPSPVVRAALAEACAPSARTPRALVVALSCDVAEVARPILARSPVLTDADLVDAAALADEATRGVIARRHHLSHAVSGALAELAEPETLIALLGNPTARITAGRLLRMVERYGRDADLREALLARADLPPEVRHAVALAVAAALADFVAASGWMSAARRERMSREVEERLGLDVSEGTGAAALQRLIRHLRAERRLNAGLILRAVLSGRSDFARTALADLTGLDHAAVARAMRDPRGVADLHRRAGLPDALLPTMQVAFAALCEAGAAPAGGLSPRIVGRALAACAEMPEREGVPLAALLTRYEAEAARDAARAAAGAVAEEAAAREAAHRASLEADTLWRAALEQHRSTEAEALAPEVVPTAATITADIAQTPEIVVVPEIVKAAEIAVTVAVEQAAEPFNPVGAILDALPGEILARFTAERAAVAEASQAHGTAATTDAILDDLGTGLLAQYRASRPAAEVPDALPIAA